MSLVWTVAFMLTMTIYVFESVSLYDETERWYLATRRDMVNDKLSDFCYKNLAANSKLLCLTECTASVYCTFIHFDHLQQVCITCGLEDTSLVSYNLDAAADVYIKQYICNAEKDKEKSGPQFEMFIGDSTWWDAYYRCEGTCRKLISVSSENKFSQIKTYIEENDKAGSCKKIWTSLVKNGLAWQWADGSDQFIPWHPNQPNNAFVQTKITLNGTKQWGLNAGHYLGPCCFICETL